MAMIEGSGRNGGELGAAFNNVAQNLLPGLHPMPQEPLIGFHSQEYSTDHALFSGDSRAMEDNDRLVRMLGVENGVRTSAGASGNRQEQAEKDREKRKKELQERMFRELLDDLNRRIQELDKQMEQSAAILRQKYGDDFIAGIAANYLTEDENENSRTDEERLQALSKKFLNADGTIRDEYKHLDEAQYVEAWQKRENAKELAAEVKASSGNITPELEKKIDKTLESSQWNEQRAISNQTSSQEITEKVNVYTQTQVSEVKSADGWGPSPT
jgi:hypothetical protein